MKSDHFIITYLAPIKKLKKFQFLNILENFGPLRSNFWTDLDLKYTVS